jgi:hypothetical protein
MTAISSVKQKKKKVLPPRDKDGRWIKQVGSTSDVSEDFPSEVSSPLDTPEINERTLADNNPSESEHEVNRQLEEREDDEDSLSGAPDQATIIPIPDISVPFPATPHIDQLIAHSASKPRPALKTSIALPLSPVQKQYLPMATTPTPSSFSGTDNENPQNFLREVERYIHLNRIADEATKVIIFGTFISAGSQADIWWNALTTAQMASWAMVKAAFTMQWPAIVVAAKSTLDYQRELLALRLKEDDVGERITVAGVSMWSHLHYHGRLLKLVQDAGVANAPVFIHQVREALPRVIRDLTSPAPATWTVFLDEIKNADINVIQDKAQREKEKKEAEKAQNLRLSKLESRQADPVEILHLQMQQAAISTPNAPAQIPPNTSFRFPANTTRITTPSNGPVRRQVCYIPASQNTMQRPRAQPPTQEEQDLMRGRINELVHHPDTTEGHTAYEEQVRQWEARWGRGARCTEQSPYPLMPGTALICSGECFRCGAHGHIGPECQMPLDNQLPKNESIWRGLSTRMLGTFNRATAPQINIVFNNVYAEEQGKEIGSSV